MRKVFMLLSATILTGCVTAKEAPNLATLSIDFAWGSTPACGGTGSPEFVVGNVPAETKWLSFQMTDLDAPAFNHGGGVVAYAGTDKIPEGAFSYTGPCPPSRHTYQWTVTALSADKGTVLGRGKTTKSFP